MKKPILTKRRTKWASQRTIPPTFKGAPLLYNSALMDKYSKKLDALAQVMYRAYEREILKVFKNVESAITLDASLASQLSITLNDLSSRFYGLFKRESRKIATNIVDKTDKASSISVSESLKKMAGGLTIPTPASNPALTQSMKASIAENISLIKSIPQQYHKELEGAVLRAIQPNGGGTTEVFNAIRKYKGVTSRRAAFIARDQVIKITKNNNRLRLEGLGIKKGRWLCTNRAKEPREYHLALNGTLFSFDDPPIIEPKTGRRGFPGDLVGCTCTFVPELDFNDL